MRGAGWTGFVAGAIVVKPCSLLRWVIGKPGRGRCVSNIRAGRQCIGLDRERRLRRLRNAQDKTIKIGALFPMSGPGAYFGAQDKQGIELALEQLNKDGVNGYKFADPVRGLGLLARCPPRRPPSA